MALLRSVGLVLLLSLAAAAQSTAPVAEADSDGDGLSDTFEQATLQRFQPQLLISSGDCAGAPSAFAPDVSEPTPLPETEGTIYGQVFPAKVAGRADVVEVHYYHLWERDCGQHSHALDAERVSALVVAANNAPPNRSTDVGDWRALYWYASAHEDTVCENSRMHTAASLAAETNGPRVWISKGKHASYLDPVYCALGCGADECREMVALPKSARVLNLGEPGRALNGATWATAASWQLTAKMQKSDFPQEEIELLSTSQTSSIVAGPRPMTGFQTAVAIASEPPQKTSMALDQAGTHTDSALGTGARHVRRSLKRAFTSTVGFITGK